MGAVHVARMPRGIGARTGVKLTATVLPATTDRFWTISGVCRWTPPTPYAARAPITSAPSRCGLSDLPAPDVPLTAVTTTSGAASPAANAGNKARLAAVG